MPLGREAGFGSSDIVLDGTELPPSPRKKGAQPSQCLAHVYCGQMAGWIEMSLGTDVGLGPDDIVLDGAQLHPKGARPAIFGPCLLWTNGRPSQLLLSSC